MGDSDSSCSSESSDEEGEDDEDEDDKEDDSVSRWRRVKGGLRVDDDKGIIGNIPWTRRCSGSFGDLLSWPDLGGLASSGVVKLWDNLDINGEGSVASFFGKCSPSVLLAARNKGTDGVEVGAWDARAGFEMPALLAEWRQPGRLLGKIIGVEVGDVEKIYVGNDGGEEMTVGDMRMVKRMVTEETMVRRRRRH
ncbi:hypothetical protein AALP_AA1G267400 [Arabis alpina]|uniref:Uncharacterized protein n=1 Tax=Arabis alpina TaxID=50452 RepID=A0A087HQW9_ARAAL|nr:hypothetical protein AALP_AA1G267400 [Arabis alpina]